MTTHDREVVIAATIGCIEGPYDRSRAITITGNEIERNGDLVTGLEACDEQVESLRQQLAEANEHIEYLLSRDKAWADIDSLKEQQLADSQKQVTLLRAALRHLWNERTPDSYDEAGEALAATADLDGVILCDAEPVAWQTFDGEGGYDYRSYEDNEDYRDDYIKRNSSQKFYENWVIPLYRAWKP